MNNCIQNEIKNLLVSSSKMIRMELCVIKFLCSLFVLVLLLDGGLALLEDGSDLARHEGPGHVGPGKGASLPARAEHFIVRSLLLDRVGGAREAKFVMSHGWALKREYY